MTVHIYGIKNCSTMKKAFAWLDGRNVTYRFHDYRKFGVDAEALARWCERLGWRALVNTRGTTWRKLDPARQEIACAADAISLMCDYPSVIRRPVVESPSGALLVGFDEDAFARDLAPLGDAA